LSVLCVGLFIALVLVMRNINSRFYRIMDEVMAIRGLILKIPAPVQNIIHLGLQDGQVTTGLMPATVSIRPEDFKVNADRLYENLVKEAFSKADRDLGIRAWCILKNSGVRDMVSRDSANEVEKALTRLLNNGERESIKQFLRTLADSISNPPKAKTPKPVR
ncbi:MAG: hypothetical protein NTX96_03220, partial [Candidatus Zambryskibacteria bacterium]|nr:hypothetical protein [Candidatus Zambryskibacteria bacterium]